MANIITATVKNVTPEMAAAWLAENLGNQRALQRPRVEKYKAEMLEGDWLITGEPLIFDTEGKLLNGQHRLTSSSEAKITLRNQVIVNGVDRDAFRAMDTGAPRLAADVLTIAGHGEAHMRYAKTLGTAAGFAVLYSRGIAPNASSGKYGGSKKWSNATVVTHLDILRFVEKNPVIKSSNKLVLDQQKFNKLVLPSSFLVWAHYQGRRLDVKLADEMVQKMITGEGMKSGDPFLVLRELLVEERASRKKSNRGDVMAGIVKMWNARRGGEKVTQPGRVFKHDWDKFPRFQ